MKRDKMIEWFVDALIEGRKPKIGKSRMKEIISLLKDEDKK